jgi:hypothetical protein
LVRWRGASRAWRRRRSRRGRRELTHAKSEQRNWGGLAGRLAKSEQHVGLKKNMIGQMGTGLWVSKKGRGWRRGMGKRVGEVGTKELEGSAGRLAKSEQRNWGLARARMGRGWCWVGGGIGHGPPSSAGSRGWLRCRVQGRLISQRVRRIVTYRRVHNTSSVAQRRVRGRRAPCRGAHGVARGGQGHK